MGSWNADRGGRTGLDAEIARDWGPQGRLTGGGGVRSQERIYRPGSPPLAVEEDVRIVAIS